eukprot:scaffold3859_cov122-Isochrysis_galbana.AAC.1
MLLRSRLERAMLPCALERARRARLLLRCYCHAARAYASTAVYDHQARKINLSISIIRRRRERERKRYSQAVDVTHLTSTHAFCSGVSNGNGRKIRTTGGLLSLRPAAVGPA